MSDAPDDRIPLMPPERAQDIARGLKWLAQSYAEAGMSRGSDARGSRQPVVADLCDLACADAAASDGRRRMSDALSLEFIGKELRAIQEEQRSQRMRLDMLSGRFDALAAQVATRRDFEQLIEVMAARLNDGFTALDVRLAAIVARLPS